MSAPATATLKIGTWIVDEASLRVFSSGTEEKLQPKIMSLLLVLASQPGSVFTREELIAQVWPETLATDDTLNNAIRKLRKVLTPDEMCSTYIETIPKRGYRLCAPVSTPEHIEQKSAVELQDTPARQHLGALSISFFLLLISLAAFGYFYHKKSGEKSELYSDLSKPIREVYVSSQEEAELFPSLSADGKHVVFLRVSKSMLATQLIVKNLEQNEELLLLDKTGLYSNPVWSPGGEHIAYIELSMMGCSVFTIGARGGPSKFISDCSPLLISTLRPSLAWSPDGRHLIVPRLSPNLKQQALFRIDVTSGESEQISFPTEDSIGDASPAFSPTGDRLAFIRSSNFYADSAVILPYEKRSGPTSWRKEAIVLKTDLGPSLGITWITDHSLMYASAKRGIYEMWSIDTKSGETKHVGVGGKSVVHPQFIFKNKALIMSDLQVNANIVLRKQTETGIELLAEIESSKWELSGKIANNKQHIAFVRIVPSGSELWIYTINSALSERVFTTEHHISSLSWSPGDNKIAMNVNKNNTLYLHMYERENSRDYPLPISDTHSQHHPEWTNVGESLLYTTEIEGKWHVFSIDIATLETTLVVEDGGNKVAFNAESNSLFLTRENDTGFWHRILEKNSKAPTQISGTEKYNILSWDFENNAFYYLKSAPSVMPTIYKYDLTGNIETIFYQGRIFYDMDIKEDYFVTSELKQLSGDVFLYDYTLEKESP